VFIVFSFDLFFIAQMASAFLLRDRALKQSCGSLAQLNAWAMPTSLLRYQGIDLMHIFVSGLAL
jgi:hypothetical protein